MATRCRSLHFWAWAQRSYGVLSGLSLSCSKSVVSNIGVGFSSSSGGKVNTGAAPRVWHQLLRSQSFGGVGVIGVGSHYGGSLLAKETTSSNNKLSTAYTTRSVAINRGLLGHREGLSLLGVGSWSLGIQQVRQVMVEVPKDDLERAIRKMKRKLKEDGGIRVVRTRQYFLKPSDLKVLAGKERDKRIAKRAFREKLKWIMGRRSRGF